MDSNIYNNDELVHWGVRGMRWGVRRYQNKDGSLTAAGKKKLRTEQAKVREQEKTIKNRQSVQNRLDRLEARKKAVAEAKEELDAKSPKAMRKAAKEAKKAAKEEAKNGKKSIKDMTDEELLAAVNRARLEDSYNQLRPQAEKHPLMKKLTNEVVVPAAVNSGKKFLENFLNKAAEKALGDKVDPDSIDALKKTAEKLDLQNRIAKAQDQLNKRKKGGASDDDDLSWDDRLKKQTYEQNKKKYAEEEAAKAAKKKSEAAAEAAKKQSDADAKKKAKESEAEAKKKAKEAEADDETKTKKAPEVTIEGEGTSKRKSDDNSYRYDGDNPNGRVYDTTASPINDTDISSGRSYTSDRLTSNTTVLALPPANISSGRDYITNSLDSGRTILALPPARDDD